MGMFEGLGCRRNLLLEDVRAQSPSLIHFSELFQFMSWRDQIDGLGNRLGLPCQEIVVTVVLNRTGSDQALKGKLNGLVDALCAPKTISEASQHRCGNPIGVRECRNIYCRYLVEDLLCLERITYDDLNGESLNKALWTHPK